MISFRQQLWRWLLALLTAVELLAGASAFWTTLHESEEFLDRQIFEIAANIAANTGTTDNLPTAGPIVPQTPVGHRDHAREESSDDPEDAIAVQIWGPTAALLYAAPSGIDIPRQTRGGHADTDSGGVAWRTYTLILPERTVQVSQQAAVRRKFAETAAINAVIPIAALIPLSWLLLWLERVRHRQNQKGDSQGSQKVIQAMSWVKGGQPWMTRPYSEDLRERVVRVVESGTSRNAAAKRFDVSISFVVKLMQRWKQRGTIKADKYGGWKKSNLAPHGDRIRALVMENCDITIDELCVLLAAEGIEAKRSTLGDFLLAQGLSRKKRQPTPPSRSALTSRRREPLGATSNLG